MSTAKSSYDNCLWSTTGHTDGQQYQVINNHINDMDYYLFGDNDISTSELVERVLSKSMVILIQVIMMAVSLMIQ